MNEFEQGTKNSAIFQLSAPYDNPYQGSYPRWLFVCSAGLLRSPTGAALANQRGINARACGAALNYALIPISNNLVMWAHKIVFVCSEVEEMSRKVFRNQPELLEHIDAVGVTLDIPDRYEYMQRRLVKHFERELFEPLGFSGHS